MATALSLSLLAAWLVLSILVQFDVAAARALKGHDVFSLLPRWSFFAPRPGTFDYHLLYRDFLGNELAGWREIPLADARTVGGALWNPEKRCRKALSDTVRALTHLLNPRFKSTLVLSIPYLTTLNYVASLEHDARTTATQFMILRTNGFFAGGEPQLVVLSELHRR